MIVLENEGNGRLVSSLPRCHVVLAGLERVLETTADAAFMVEQLTLAAVGRELPSYVSWLSGPAADGDDGPEEFVVIVVDNGRSRVRESDEREILNCIRCGSCLTVCPVYSKVGGHAYGSVYGGPIGAVLTPLLTDMQPGRGPQAAVPVVALRRLHRRLPRRHPAARHARARPHARQPRRRGRSQRARRLGRLGARLVESPPVPRLGAGRCALRAVRAGLRAGREAGSTGRATLPLPSTQAVPPALERPGERRVIDAFIAALRGRRQARRVHVADIRGRARVGGRAAGPRHDALLLERRSARDCRSTPPRSAASPSRRRPAPASPAPISAWPRRARSS